MVTSILPHFGLVVKLPFGCTGTVAITDLADAYKPNPLAAFSKDQLLRSVNAPTTVYACNAYLTNVFDRHHLLVSETMQHHEMVECGIFPFFSKLLRFYHF